MPGTPLTDTDRATIASMHAEGVSAYRIAKHLGRAVSTVTREARRQGLVFDGAARMAAAVETAQASNRERRAAAVARLYDRAERILDRLDSEQFKVVGFDKSGNAVVTAITADAIPGTEERALSGMAINALVAAARLEQVDAAHADTSEAKGILGNLQDALGAAYAQLSHTSSRAAALNAGTDGTDTEAQQ